MKKIFLETYDIGAAMAKRNQLEAEEQRTKELQEYKIYVKTKQYAEEVAKDKLGLVYPDEILLKPTK